MKRGYLVEIGMTVKNMVYIIVLGVFYLFLIQGGRSVLQSNHYADRCSVRNTFLSDAHRMEGCGKETQQRGNTAAVRF